MIKEEFINRLSQNLPYTPTEEQALVMAKLVTFVFRATGRDVFLLKGYAGTGKSSLVGALVKTLSQFSMKSVLLHLPILSIKRYIVKRVSRPI